MEILTKDYIYNEAVFTTILLVLAIIATFFAAMILSGQALAHIWEIRVGDRVFGYIMLIFAIFFWVGFGTSIYQFVDHLGTIEPDKVEVRAIVDDYNEVYERDYEVIGGDGKITILEKDIDKKGEE